MDWVARFNCTAPLILKFCGTACAGLHCGVCRGFIEYGLDLTFLLIKSTFVEFIVVHRPMSACLFVQLALLRNHAVRSFKFLASALSISEFFDDDLFSVTICLSTSSISLFIDSAPLSRWFALVPFRLDASSHQGQTFGARSLADILWRPPLDS